MSLADHQLRAEDRRRLAAAFATAFDRSRTETLMARVAAAPGAAHEGMEPLGEGTHFHAWKLRSPRPEAGRMSKLPTVAVVLKLAKPEWSQPGAPKARRWVEAMRRLGRGAPDLVPPLEILQVGGRVGVAMPFGEAPLADAAAHWQPVADHLEALAHSLSAYSLSLGDIAQGRCWSGVPFLYDFSDLGPG